MSLDIQPSGELATECPHTRRLPADHYAFFNAARRLTMNLNAIRDFEIHESVCDYHKFEDAFADARRSS